MQGMIVVDPGQPPPQSRISALFVQPPGLEIRRAGELESRRHTFTASKGLPFSLQLRKNAVKGADSVHCEVQLEVEVWVTAHPHPFGNHRTDESCGLVEGLWLGVCVMASECRGDRTFFPVGVHRSTPGRVAQRTHPLLIPRYTKLTVTPGVWSACGACDLYGRMGSPAR